MEVPEALDFETTAAVIGARGGRGALRGLLDGWTAVPRTRDRAARPRGVARARERVARHRRRARAGDAPRTPTSSSRTTWSATASTRSSSAGSRSRCSSRCPAMRPASTLAGAGNSVERVTHQLRALGQGVQPSYWDRLSSLRMPVLLVTGAYDRKYRDLAERMAAAIGDNACTVTRRPERATRCTSSSRRRSPRCWPGADLARPLTTARSPARSAPRAPS